MDCPCVFCLLSFLPPPVPSLVVRFVSHHPFRSIRDEWTLFHIGAYLRKYEIVDRCIIDRLEYTMLERISSDVYELYYYRNDDIWIGVEVRSCPRRGVFRVMSYVIISH